MLRIVIGLQNYSGVACGVNFEKSVGQNIPEDWTVEQPQVKRLLALFPGTTVETVEGEHFISSDEPEEPIEEAREVEIISADDVGSVSDVLGVEKVEEAPVAEPVEEDAPGPVPGQKPDEPPAEEEAEEEPEVDDEAGDEDKPLAAGDDVLAHYKGEFRKGKVVKVLESGVVRVNIDGDDANYRVLDDDKVTRLDPKAAE